jgi:hypothetical protein
LASCPSRLLLNLMLESSQFRQQNYYQSGDIEAYKALPLIPPALSLAMGITITNLPVISSIGIVTVAADQEISLMLKQPCCVMQKH